MLWDADIDIDEFNQKLWDEKKALDANLAVPDRKLHTTQWLQPILDLAIRSINDKKQQLYEDQEAKIKNLEEKIRQMKEGKDQSPQKSSSSDLPCLTPKRKQTEEQATQEPPSKKLAVSKAWTPTYVDRPLANSAPRNSTAAAVRDWLNSQSKLLREDERAKFLDYVDQCYKAFQDMEARDQPSMKDVAAQWGLPVQQAATFTKPALLKLSAAAAYMAA